MTPSREAIEAALDAYFAEDGMSWRSFHTADEMKKDMQSALTAAYARDFPQPSKSDEERAAEDRAAILEQTLDECEAIARKQESHTSGWMAASRNIAVAIATLKRKGTPNAQ